MGFKFGIIFTIVVILSIVFASVFLIVKYMEFMYQRNSKEKSPLVIEKYYNNLNNYQKNKNKEIIIDIDCQVIKERRKLLTGIKKNVT